MHEGLRLGYRDVESIESISYCATRNTVKWHTTFTSLERIHCCVFWSLELLQKVSGYESLRNLIISANGVESLTSSCIAEVVVLRPRFVQSDDDFDLSRFTTSFARESNILDSFCILVSCSFFFLLFSYRFLMCLWIESLCNMDCVAVEKPCWEKLGYICAIGGLSKFIQACFYNTVFIYHG